FSSPSSPQPSTTCGFPAGGPVAQVRFSPPGCCCSPPPPGASSPESSCRSPRTISRSPRRSPTFPGDEEGRSRLPLPPWHRLQLETTTTAFLGRFPDASLTSGQIPFPVPSLRGALAYWLRALAGPYVGDEISQL